jgi:hypothetical protein
VNVADPANYQPKHVAVVVFRGTVRVVECKEVGGYSAGLRFLQVCGFGWDGVSFAGFSATDLVGHGSLWRVPARCGLLHWHPLNSGSSADLVLPFTAADPQTPPDPRYRSRVLPKLVTQLQARQLLVHGILLFSPSKSSRHFAPVSPTREKGRG